MNIQKDEAFEEAYSKICKPIIARPYPRNEKGEYFYKEIHEAHLMWQAAQAQTVPEGFVLMPKEPNEAIKRALSYQCFDFISVANVYRNLGFDIPKKAEGEQSFFLHKFLLLAITHGNDFVKVFNEETKAMVEAQEQSHD